YRFNSTSDTEVILHAYEEWDLKCLDKFCGMFAFAIWDQRKNRLFCARDRFGMKPFYYFFNGDSFLFASEIKQLFFSKSVMKEPNDIMIYDYLVHGFTDHSSETMFKHIRQLPPAHYLTLDLHKPVKAIEPNSYWKLTDFSTVATNLSPEKYSEQFFELFSRSVRQHLRSDVRVGSCLSGGIDSSSIVCLIHSILNDTPSPSRQLTFSSISVDKNYDEQEYSNAVVKQTGAQNHTVFPNLNEVLNETDRMLDYHDEPFGSSSHFAQWCLFREIGNNNLSVILDGQGADEILAGYHSCLGSFFLQRIKEMRLALLFQEVNQCKALHGYKGDQILKFIISSLAIHTLGPRLAFLRPPPKWIGSEFYHQARRKSKHHDFNFSNNTLNNFLSYLIHFNLGALLRSEDRNSMAHSVEARLPFLDHRLVEFMFSAPMDQKINNGWTKVILRNAMKDHIPEKIRLRKDKMGFVTSEQQWISSIPQKTIDDLLFSRPMKESGYIDVKQTSKELRTIIHGNKPFNFLPWRILSLSIWLNKLKTKTDL
ncbi:MAG: asparagine synthase (glutamine-hydrolyzing), partial [Nitrospinales bacterium]